MFDLRIQTFGPLCSITPLSTEGLSWLLRNVEAEPGQWLGGSLLLEICIGEGIYDGARGDGLEVELREVLEII